MRYLLDTQAFLWWDMQSSRLSATAFALCQDRSNTLLLSMANVWEIQIKHQLGKLELGAPLDKIIQKQRETNGIELLSIELAHILDLSNLADHHRDPFDRLLIAQARVENMTLISNDPQIGRYGVPVAW